MKYFDEDDVYFVGHTDGINFDAVALLIRRSRWSWQVYLPSQAPIGPIIVDNRKPEISPEQMLDGLIKLLPGNALVLGLMRQDPDYPGIEDYLDETKVDLLDRKTTINIAVDVILTTIGRLAVRVLGKI